MRSSHDPIPYVVVLVNKYRKIIQNYYRKYMGGYHATYMKELMQVRELIVGLSYPCVYDHRNHRCVQKLKHFYYHQLWTLCYVLEAKKVRNIPCMMCSYNHHIK